MSNIFIRVEGLGKLYRIGAPEPYWTLRDTLTLRPMGALNLREGILANRAQ
jgi:hypothetical protein